MRSRRQQRQRTRDGAALSSGPASGHRAGRGRTARTHAAGASPTAVQSVLARRAFARAQTKELFFVKKAKNKCDTQRQTRRTSSAAARASAPASQPAPPPLGADGRRVLFCFQAEFVAQAILSPQGQRGRQCFLLLGGAHGAQHARGRRASSFRTARLAPQAHVDGPRGAPSELPRCVAVLGECAMN